MRGWCILRGSSSLVVGQRWSTLVNVVQNGSRLFNVVVSHGWRRRHSHGLQTRARQRWCISELYKAERSLETSIYSVSHGLQFFQNRKSATGDRQSVVIVNEQYEAE
jgi:hypothetical protein